MRPTPQRKITREKLCWAAYTFHDTNRTAGWTHCKQQWSHGTLDQLNNTTQQQQQQYVYANRLQIIGCICSNETRMHGWAQDHQRAQLPFRDPWFKTSGHMAALAHPWPAPWCSPRGRRKTACHKRTTKEKHQEPPSLPQWFLIGGRV